MNRSLRIGLIGAGGIASAYADLFDPSPGDPPVAQGWPCVGDGWRNLLERACVRIRAAVQADGGTFKAAQIKEKFATLRFYWDGTLSTEAAARVEEAIDLAEACSACTCDSCGQEGWLYRSGGCLMTRCAQHADGGRLEGVKSHLRNVRVETRIVGDRKMVRCRRYVRETDSFVDVDPASLDLEEE